MSRARHLARTRRIQRERKRTAPYRRVMRQTAAALADTGAAFVRLGAEAQRAAGAFADACAAGLGALRL